MEYLTEFMLALCMRLHRQLLCAAPEATTRYAAAAESVFNTAPNNPAEDYIGEFTKLVVGLTTERYMCT